MSKVVKEKTLEGSIWNNFALPNLTHLTNVELFLSYWKQKQSLVTEATSMFNFTVLSSDLIMAKARRNKLPAFWHLRQFHNSWFATWSGIKSVQNYFVRKSVVGQRTLEGFKCYFRSRRSGIKTDRFPKRAPMVQVSRDKKEFILWLSFLSTHTSITMFISSIYNYNI